MHLDIDTSTAPPNDEIWHMAYLALGANLGDRQHALYEALHHLQKAVRIERVSSIYETEPVGYLDQPTFLNMVCQGRTQLTAHSLLTFVKGIETTLGRQPTFRNGPRAIDIDILLYDQLLIEENTLQIPHPRMTERAFVLVPLAEIAPDLVVPGQHQAVRTLLAAIQQTGVNKIAQPRCKST